MTRERIVPKRRCCTILLLGLGAGILAACSEDRAERAGQSVGNVSAKVGQTVENLAAKTGRGGRDRQPAGGTFLRTGGREDSGQTRGTGSARYSLTAPVRLET